MNIRKINKKSDYFLLAVCALLNVAALAGSIVGSSSLSRALAQLQIFFSAVMVARFGFVGFLTAVCENALGFVIALTAFFSSRVGFSAQTALSSAISVVLVFILQRHFQLLRTEADSMYKKAVTDSLTGLVNHQNFIIEMEAAIARDNEAEFAVMFIDVDNFKRINDTLGHQVGDEFLLRTVKNMQSVVDSRDTIARMGGDEFAVLVPRPISDDALYRYAAKIASEAASPFQSQNKLYQITASLGIARYPKDAKTAGDVIHQADMAMYRAKSLGKNRIVFFDEKMQESIDHRRVMEKALKKAIENGEMHIEYQPQYAVKTRTLRGFEAFVRWQSRIFGDMNPSQFILIAEEMGIMTELGEWILSEACLEYAKVQSSYAERAILSVNISCSQLIDPSFVPFVRETISRTGIDPSLLEFEITEKITEFSEDTVISVLGDLKRLGIKISLDDFGTGFSSINALRKLPLDTLKIDSSFTRSLFGKKDASLISSLIEIAHSLNLKVIAEGVEKESEMQELSKFGCDFAQGFLFARALPIAAL